MPEELLHQRSGSYAELDRLVGELAGLRANLADRELALVQLRSELATFEALYLRQVGALYAQLDGLHARIAEVIAETTGLEEDRATAEQARERARTTQEATDEATKAEASRVTEFLPQPELKKLYREVVLQVHPDRCTDDSDRDLRQRLMAEANLAYRRLDAVTLERILDEYRGRYCDELLFSSVSTTGEEAHQNCARIQIQIDRIRLRVEEIERELNTLANCEIGLLRDRVQRGSREGRDLLAEMSAHLLQRINEAQEWIEESRNEEVLQ